MSFSKPSNYCSITRLLHPQDLLFCTSCGYAADTIDLTESPVPIRTISAPTRQSIPLVRNRASQDHLQVANQRATQRQESHRDAGSTALSIVRPPINAINLQRYRINVSLFHRSFRYENRQAREMEIREPVRHFVTANFQVLIPHGLWTSFNDFVQQYLLAEFTEIRQTIFARRWLDLIPGTGPSRSIRTTTQLTFRSANIRDIKGFIDILTTEKEMPQLHLTLETEQKEDDEESYDLMSPPRVHKKPYTPVIKTESKKKIKIEVKSKEEEEDYNFPEVVQPNIIVLKEEEEEEEDEVEEEEEEEELKREGVITRNRGKRKNKGKNRTY